MQIVPELSHSIIIECNKNLYISSKNNTPPPKKKDIAYACQMPYAIREEQQDIAHKQNKTKQPPKCLF